jgi:glycosyltransferase involved in cell wall biosynthesis
LRLLYFSRDYTTHDHRFLTSLARTDHEVYYLRLERRGHQLEDRALPPDINLVPWVGGNTPARLQDSIGLLRDLKRVIKSVKPDLVQAGPLQRSAFLVALTGYRPLLSMSWGYDLIHDANKNRIWRWVTRYALKRSTIMLGDCDTIRQLAVSYGMPDERIVTFPWGIDLRHFSPGEDSNLLNQDKQTFTILSTRGWEPIYGVDVIARAFALAAGQRPELQLMMLGNGSLAAELRHIFMGGGVEDRVHFTGQVSQDVLPRIYRSADLYVSASHSDGTSISLLEAMACGCPVLVSDIPGNREWVTPDHNGWLFSDGDVGALADSILCAVDDRDRLRQAGANARQLAEQRANWDENFLELLKAYDLALTFAI